jgi:hypothetical protein
VVVIISKKYSAAIIRPGEMVTKNKEQHAPETKTAPLPTVHFFLFISNG